MLVAVLIALRVAGLGPRTLALGGAFTAVVVGLAAQQTLGNLFAGMVLLSARPFRVGERVSCRAAALAGTVEGVVSSLGLLYTTLASGDDSIMVPNSVVLNVAIVPLREPDGDRSPRAPAPRPHARSTCRTLLQNEIETPMRDDPADHARGARRRRGRRAHLGDAGAAGRRAAARGEVLASSARRPAPTPDRQRPGAPAAPPARANRRAAGRQARRGRS